MWKKYNPVQRLILLFSKNKQYDEKKVIIKKKNYLIRPITLSDIKDLLSIEREVYDGEMPWTKTAFLMELQSQNSKLYILIEAEGKVVGFIGCRLLKKDAHITNVAVSTAYQGKGIGSFLMSEMKNYAKSSNCETMSLEVRMSNKNAQRVYRRLGFASSSIRRNYYDEDNEDALEMILKLEEV